MAGTPLKVVVTGNPSSDVLACAATINAIITFLDAHTHSGVTTGSDTSGATSTASTATPLYNVDTGAAIAYTTG